MGSKIDYARNYYADLGLDGPTQDTELIKKQYRKLSLKKHPDRPGGSNEEFNIISQAHSILTDPALKSKYDSNRSAGMPRAFGQRGNPWATAGSQWAPPPRHPTSNYRTQQASNTQKRQSSTSNADRYAEFTASAQRRPTSKKAESAQTWQAWEGMRAGSKGKANAQGTAPGTASARASGTSGRSASYAAPPPPPPVPPRPAPAKQPKGSFGARVQRGGYIPESPGDEPSVTNNNYFTTRTHSHLFSETSEAARSRRREPTDDDDDQVPSLDPRQSTPYQNHGGEKFDPYIGASNIGRSRSSRERYHTSGESEGDEARPARQERPNAQGDADNRPHASHGVDPSSDGHDGVGSANDSPREGNSNGSGSGKASSNLYANSFRSAPHFSSDGFPYAVNHMANGTNNEAVKQKIHKLQPDTRFAFDQQETVNSVSSSEDKSRKKLEDSMYASPNTPRQNGLNVFDESLRGLITRLSAQKYNRSDMSVLNSNSNQTFGADQTNYNSFGTPVPEDTFTADSHRFTSNSTDNINTSFVDEDDPREWQFNAGSPVGQSGRPAMPRSKSGSGRIGRQPSFNPYNAQPAFGTTENGDARAATPTQNGSFNPQEWSEIGPQIFDPSTAQKTSTTRTSRSQSRKPKPVRMTTGGTGLADSDESSGQDESLKAPRAQSHGRGVDGASSPNAMDVDTPISHAYASNTGARNMPVTPSRPEWRAGDMGLGINTDPKAGTTQQPVGGSEDTEEFRASFADLRNVEPFAQHATGLNSFGDMKANLPFPSAASGHIPGRKPVPKPQKLTLPEPPKAPAAPPALGVQGLTPSAVSWKKYAEAFYMYLAQWQAYSAQFADHFHARKIQTAEKLNNPAWINSQDGTGLQEYMTWMVEDREVRSKWTEACDEHEMSVRLFQAHRDKMMK